MQVEWRIPESAPYFMVSNTGEVMAADTKRRVNLSDNGSGYKQAQIMRKCKRYTKYVHRLVAECFLDNPNGLPEVNHLDGDKANNNVNNLEWCTRSENQIHAIRNGLIPPVSQERREMARKLGKETIRYARAGWKEWAKTDKAKETWANNIKNADRWGTRNEPAEVKAARRREKKRLYYQEHKEEFSRKAHERYMKAKERNSA